MSERASDPLFLAMTRPALVAGIPIEAAGFCVIFGAVTSFVLFQSMLGFFLTTPIGAVIVRLLAIHDPLIFRVLWSHIRSRPRASIGLSSRAYWGGVSLSPLAADVDESSCA